MMMNGCGGAMWLWTLLFLVLIVGGIWLVVRAVRGSDSAPASADSSALRILEERFARGDIDRDEFDDRRRALSS